MNLSLFIARRYFLSRKKKNFINVISIISMIVVAIGTMALIIVLSVFNGLEGLLRSIYGTVDPNLIVNAAEGKSFAYDDALKSKIEAVDGIAIITEVVEDNALLKYNNSQRVTRLKGVSDNFLADGRLQENIVYGEPVLTEGSINYAILGRGVQYDLSVNPANDFYAIQVYYPGDIKPGMTNPESLFRVKNITPGAVFAIENYFDNTYVFVPLRFTESLFGYYGRRTSLEIQLAEDATLETVRQKLQQTLGDSFRVISSEELHSDLYKTLRIEKFFLFLTFSIIIAIASINIFFSLNMLVLDKRKDVAILLAQGATRKLIRNIFLFEGSIVAFTGAGTGLLAGLIICWLQQNFGLISTGTETTIMTAYPVVIQPLDVLFTALCIVVITILATVQPAATAAKRASLTEIQ